MMVGLHCIIACSNDSLDVVKYLVTECKCDTMSTDNDGWNIHCIVACSNGSLDVMKYLVTECKCDPMSTDNIGEDTIAYCMQFQ